MVPLDAVLSPRSLDGVTVASLLVARWAAHGLL